MTIAEALHTTGQSYDGPFVGEDLGFGAHEDNNGPWDSGVDLDPDSLLGAHEDTAEFEYTEL